MLFLKRRDASRNLSGSLAQFAGNTPVLPRLRAAEDEALSPISRRPLSPILRPSATRRPRRSQAASYQTSFARGHFDFTSISAGLSGNVALVAWAAARGGN